MTGISCKTTYPITGLVEKTIKHHTKHNLCGNINKVSVNRVYQTTNPTVHQNITLQQISSHKIACCLISPLGTLLMYLIPDWSYEALRLRECSTAHENYSVRHWTIPYPRLTNTGRARKNSCYTMSLSQVNISTLSSVCSRQPLNSKAQKITFAHWKDVFS